MDHKKTDTPHTTGPSKTARYNGKDNIGVQLGESFIIIIII